MTANNASSAPTDLPDESNEPSDEDEDLKTDVEEFFANFSYAEEDEPVRIIANMISDDLLMIPKETTSTSPALPEPREENLHTLRNLCNITDTHDFALTLPPVTRPTYSSSSSVFDDEYEHGVRKRSTPPAAPPTHQLQPLSYVEAFRTELKTTADVDKHEQRIYLKGKNPISLRHNITHTLSTLKPEQYIEAFQLKDIPPSETDHRTHTVLHTLMQERNAQSRAMESLLDRISTEPTMTDNDIVIDEAYNKLDRIQNDTNRSMHQIFAASKYIIHENNFVSYCKPHLKNLPSSTGYELQALRNQMDDEEKPPYRPIQNDPLPRPTIPTFQNTLQQHYHLKPRTHWMRDTPPFLTDEEADNTYHAACAWTFGTNKPEPIVWNTITTTAPSDPNHPDHEYAQRLRRKLQFVLDHRDYVKDFKRKYVPHATVCFQTHNRLNALLDKRDRVENELEILLSDLTPEGLKRDIEPEYDRLSDIVNKYNRQMYRVFVSFLTPIDTVQPPPTSTIHGIRTTMKDMLDAKGKEESSAAPRCVRRNDGPTHDRLPSPMSFLKE